jgi:hypothetical protein
MKTFKAVLDRSIDWLEPKVGTPICAGILSTTLALVVFCIPAFWNGVLWWVGASVGTGIGNALGLWLAQKIWR